MSVAVIPMAKELGWSASDRGLVSSAFFWGYSLTQIPAGYVSTRWPFFLTCIRLCFTSSPLRHCVLSILPSQWQSKREQKSCRLLIYLKQNTCNTDLGSICKAVQAVQLSHHVWFSYPWGIQFELKHQPRALLLTDKVALPFWVVMVYFDPFVHQQEILNA